MDAQKPTAVNRRNLYFTMFLVNLPYVGLGHCVGWSSPSLPLLRSPDFFIHVDQNQASWVASLLGLGGIFGPVLAGCLMDAAGRKFTMIINNLLLLSAWTIMYFAWRVEMMYLARFVMGITMAVTFCAIPVYTAEVSEPKLRNMLNSVPMPTRSAAMLISVSVGPYISYRQMIMMSAIGPALFLLLSPLVRESPYYLVSKGKSDKAVKAFSWLRTGISEDECKKQIEVIQESVMNNKKQTHSIVDLLKTETNRRALVMSTSLLALTQLCGATVVLFYLEPILKTTRTPIPSSVAALAGAASMFISGLASLPIIKKFGYIKPLIYSAVGSGVAAGILGLYFFLEDRHFDSPIINWMPVFGIILYMLFFSVALMNVPWSITSEVFPPSVKAQAVSLAVSICYILVYATSKIFPNMVHMFGSTYTFWIYSGFSFVTVIFIYCFVPETKGLSLEEIQLLISKPLWSSKPLDSNINEKSQSKISEKQSYICHL